LGVGTVLLSSSCARSADAGEDDQVLQTDYAYDERAATLLMGNLMEYESANVVDPHFTWWPR
jgi:hypothetical protein